MTRGNDAGEARPSGSGAARRDSGRPAGVLLAGGRSHRMGGVEKAFLPLGGQTILARVLARLAPQAGPLVISANGDPARFAATGLPVVADPVGGFAGPLAGVLGGMLWAREQAPQAARLLSVATDTPFFPLDLAGRLGAAATNPGTVVVASSRGRIHPVIGLWPVGLADDLAAWLAGRDHRAVRGWLDRQDVRTVDFDGPVDPFFNINTPKELAAAEARLAETGP